MSNDQEQTGEGCNTLPVNASSPLNGLCASVVTGDAKSFDNLRAAQAGAACGEHPSGTQAPIPAPAAPQPACWANLPSELRALKAWCIAGPDKRPLTTAGTGASVTNPDTWVDFHSACMVAREMGQGYGIGFVLAAGQGLACIDLDVKDDTPQDQIDRYQHIITSFATYTERSRSGLGVHIWVLGQVGSGCRREGVEVYSQERFIICTGDAIDLRPVQNRQELLELLVADIRGAQAVSRVDLVETGEHRSDEEVWRMATNAGNADKFMNLWKGDWVAQGYPSQSEADLSLLSILCFYSKSNSQVRRMFRASELGKREKAARDDKYIDRSLSMIRGREEREAKLTDAVKAGSVALLGRNMRKRVQPTRATPVGRIRLLGADEIAARPLMKWLVRGVLPEKGVGAIFGQPGSGKSFLVLDLLAAVSGGYYWFGIPTKAVPVVYINLEGQAGMPQRIRAYRAKKGQLDRIMFIEQPIDLRERENLRQLIDIVQDAGLGGGVVCIDTLAASAPGMDENTSADMGQLIANLQDLQAELGGFVLVVHHSGKDETRGLRGWSGLNGALDCAIAVTRVSEDKRNTNRRWEVSKSKDGSDGVRNDFVLEQVLIDYDEDGQSITSCVISHAVSEKANAIERHAEIDTFVWEWIKVKNEKGEHPSGRSLEGQRDAVSSQIKLSQTQLRHSIDRLKEAKRLATVSEKGNPWLQAVEYGADV